jgi:hypothetical protein
MPINSKKTYEYINEFMYFVIRPFKSRAYDALIYCSGVDFVRFIPITEGRYRPMANPAIRGLQLVNLGVRALALSNGATPRVFLGNDCEGIVPPRNGWYKDLLLIENAPESLPHDIINYCPLTLLKKILNACCLMEVELPERPLQPDELQVFIETLCSQYGRQF